MSVDLRPAPVSVEGSAGVKDPLGGAVTAVAIRCRGGAELTLGGPAALLGVAAAASESALQLNDLARHVAAIGGHLLMGRSAPDADQGPWQRLADAAAAHGLGLVLEVDSARALAAAATMADILQIQCGCAADASLLAAVGALAKPVLLVRPAQLSVPAWLEAGARLAEQGSPLVVYCESGCVDVGAVARLQHGLGRFVALDLPCGSADSDLIVPIVRAGVAAGATLVLVDAQEASSAQPRPLTFDGLAHLASALGLEPGDEPAGPRPAYTSRHAEFYKRSVSERRAIIAAHADLSATSRAHLRRGGLEMELADRMSENVVSTFALPMSVALNFRVNGRDHLVPMVTEEPSVVAAASNAARMVRSSGGFRGDATASVMTAQVQFDHVIGIDAAAELLRQRRTEIIAAANHAIPRMVARGGGCTDVDVRVLDRELGLCVIHLYVDVGDAMGANVVDTVAEHVAPLVQSWIGGDIGLRILSNLPLRRLVHIECDVTAQALGGKDLADGIARAGRFAQMDPFRASTHNKGILNGIDAVAVALGQDWRAIEAGAHSYAGLGVDYRPLATWQRTDAGLHGTMELPLAIGTVGGSTQAHPGVRTAMEIIQTQSARELAVVMAAVGLASNLAALRALAGEGIQQGHMRLHARKADLAHGKRGDAA